MNNEFIQSIFLPLNSPDDQERNELEEKVADLTFKTVMQTREDDQKAEISCLTVSAMLIVLSICDEIL